MKRRNERRKPQWFGRSSVSPICPVCQLPTSTETTRHLLHCTSPHQTSVWADAIADLQLSLTKMHTCPVLTELIISYVSHRDSKLMSDLSSAPALVPLARSQDSIGWDNFMEGKVSSLFCSNGRFVVMIVRIIIIMKFTMVRNILLLQ